MASQSGLSPDAYPVKRLKEAHLKLPISIFDHILAAKTDINTLEKEYDDIGLREIASKWAMVRTALDEVAEMIPEIEGRAVTLLHDITCNTIGAPPGSFAARDFKRQQEKERA